MKLHVKHQCQWWFLHVLFHPSRIYSTLLLTIFLTDCGTLDVSFCPDSNWIQFLPAESENLLEETLLENSNQSRYKQYLVKFTLSCSVLQLCSELLRQNNPFLLILTDKVSPQQIIKWYTMQRSSLDWAFSSVIMSFILSAKSANVCFLLQTRQQRSEDRHYNTRLSRQQSAGSL